MSVVKAFVVPGIPHPLLCPEQNAGWQKLRDGFDQARQDLLDAKPDLILVYSTMWPSVVGHQIQANPSPEWVHVDELFHDLGCRVPHDPRVQSASRCPFWFAKQAAWGNLASSTRRSEEPIPTESSHGGSPVPGADGRFICMSIHESSFCSINRLGFS